MQVDICVAVTEPAIEVSKVTAIYELASICRSYLSDKSYGTEVEKIVTAFLLTRTIPGLENWFKERKPRYIFDRTTKSPLTGEMITVRKTFTYEIKPSNESITNFIEASDSDLTNFIAKECIASLSKLDKIPKNINDFDKVKFKRDFQAFFKTII